MKRVVAATGPSRPVHLYKRPDGTRVCAKLASNGVLSFEVGGTVIHSETGWCRYNQYSARRRAMEYERQDLEEQMQKPAGYLG